MQCPVDNTTLVLSEKQGIEIDYCPQCRGVWLDRGELDKLIDRSQPQDRGQDRRQDDSNSYESRDHDRRDYDEDHGKHDNRQGHKKKREGFLGDLFDF